MAPAEAGQAAQDAWAEDVWSAEEATPADVEVALRDLLLRRRGEGASHVPARVLNMVVVADREWRGEVENRLERLTRYHPSRTILCAVEPGRTKLSAWAAISAQEQVTPGTLALCRERIELDLGPQHLAELGTILNPLVVSDIATLAWSPHGHPEALEALGRLAQVVLVDSGDDPDPAAALEQSERLSKRSYVVDLAWLRSTPWRERVAADFDPPKARPLLGQISCVTVRACPGSEAAGLLFLGWLSSRLGWEPGGGGNGDGPGFAGQASRNGGAIALRLELEPEMQVPGLAGITIETAAGTSLSLDRGSGGLTARRRSDGHESVWTILGASRGEAGILGEGVRQALLRDRTYMPALCAARAMLAR